MRTRRAGRQGSLATGVATAAAVVVALGLVVLGAPSPVAADVTSISPPSREVDPGASASATVTVEWPGQTCVSAEPSTEALAPSFSRVCSDEPRWTTTLTVHAPDEPGTYSVTVSDDRSNVTKTFTLRVRQPAPPPTEPPTTAPSTTTTARPTTTAPPPTTTAPTTTASPETTPPTTAETTTTTAPLVGDPFRPLAALLDQPVPSEGVFLPLVNDGYRDCLPLSAPCGVAGAGLVLVPARAAEITWEPVPEDAAPPPRTDLRGLAPLAPVGVAPAEPRSHNYALTILDLTASGGRLRTLLRGMDERGRLGAVTADQPVLRPTIGNSGAETDDDRAGAAMPFGRPTIRTASSFTEAAPALAMFGSDEPQLIYAVRPDNAWGLNLDLVPLLGESLPYLVRGIEGPPGLFIARPPNLRVPQADDPRDEAPDRPSSEGGGVSPLLLLGGAVGLGVAATLAAAIVRRRRAPSVEAQ